MRTVVEAPEKHRFLTSGLKEAVPGWIDLGADLGGARLHEGQTEREQQGVERGTNPVDVQKDTDGPAAGRAGHKVR